MRWSAVKKANRSNETSYGDLDFCFRKAPGVIPIRLVNAFVN